MIKYFWIIEDILLTKPKKYTILLHDNFVGVVQLINLYLKNKCKYYLNFQSITHCFETDTIITLDLEWPDKGKDKDVEMGEILPTDEKCVG